MTFIHPNLKLLSSSSSVTLHGCKRRYELYKLTPPSELMWEGEQADDDEHTSFGHTVGIGVQTYLITDSLPKALFAAFMSWKKPLDDEQGDRSKKTFWYAVHAVEKFVLYRKTVLSQFDLAYFDDKPAIELGYSIDLGDGFIDRGFFDAVLIHKVTRQLAVLETKTTKIYDIHPAMYKHSGQGLGYPLVLEIIAAKLDLPVTESFDILYTIYKTLKMEWEYLPFKKSRTSKAMWIKNKLADKLNIIQMVEADYFPMHGESCFSFFRPCKYFGVCELSNDVMFPGGVEQIPVKEESDDKYQFKFNLVDIINQQIASAEQE